MGCLARSCTTVPAQTTKGRDDEGMKESAYMERDSSPEKTEETGSDKD